MLVCGFSVVRREVRADFGVRGHLPEHLKRFQDGYCFVW